MKLTQSLAPKLLLFTSSAILVTGLSTYVLVSTQMKGVIDRSQREIYREKIGAILGTLHRQELRLEATGMREAYEKDFKDAVRRTLAQLHYEAADHGVQLYIVDGKGAVVLHPRLEEGNESLAATPEVGRILASRSGDFDQRGSGADRRWLIFGHFPVWSWTVVYDVPEEVKYADVRAMQRKYFNILVSVTTLALALLFVVITAFTRPIVRLTNASRAMAEGDLEREIDTRGQDEVGILARSLAHLRDSIRQKIADLDRKNRELVTEISQREHAERALRESEETLRSTLNSLDDLVFILDRELRFIDFRQLAKVGDLYLPPEEFIGNRIQEIGLPPDVVRMFVRGLEAVERTGEAQSWDYALPYLSGERWFSAKGSRRLDDRGNYAGSVVVARDITDRKEAEEQLRKATEDLARQNVELTKLDKIKDTLIQDVTHELKTPVAKQSMQLELLREVLGPIPVDDPREAALRVLEASVHRQEKVIRNLLDLSRLEAGGRKLTIEPVRIDKVIQQVIDDYRLSIEGHGVRVGAAMEPLVALGDGEMLGHVYSNVINNALKFRRPGVPSALDIRLCREGDRAVASISDNGIGISAESLPRIFDRFYQATASSEGLGVGLDISRTLVQGMGGTISLESDGENRGCTVTITLPLA